MSGEVHLAVGAASAVLLTQPKSLDEMVVAAAVGAVGGLFCDVDTKKSKGSKLLKKVITVSTAIAALLLIGSFLNTDVRLMLSSFGIKYVSQFVGIAGFLVMCLIGTSTSHRMATHSFEFIAIATVLLSLVNQDTAVLFLIGAVSHVLLDVLNKKKVRLSLLLKLDFCLNWCSSSSKVGKILEVLSIAVVVCYPVIK